MIRSVTVENFRGLRTAELQELTRLVVLVGPNGSGKSAILDAIDIGASSSLGDALGRSVRRRATSVPSFRWLLWKGGEDCQGKILIDTSSGKRFVLLQREGAVYNLTIRTMHGPVGDDSVHERVEFDGDRYTQSPAGRIPVPGITSLRLVDLVASLRTPLHQLYTTTVEQGHRDEVMAIVRSLLDGVKGIEILTEQDLPVLHVVFKNHSVPADLAGDGVAALLRLSLELVSRKDGVVLVEEPELHQHPAALQLSAKTIATSCDQGVQVILTTHSLELIDALLENMRGSLLDEMTVFRLRLRDGELLTHRICGPDLELARSQIESDLR